jgi:hypothetical protein
VTGLSTLDRDGLVLRPRQIGNELHLEFSGSADIEAQSMLLGYFRLLHAEVARSGTTLVVVDIHELSFINSSCFKALVTWIDLLNGMPQQQRYRIRFVKDSSAHWQTRSFDALHRMGVANVSVEDWSGGET